MTTSTPGPCIGVRPAWALRSATWSRSAWVAAERWAAGGLQDVDLGAERGDLPAGVRIGRLEVLDAAHERLVAGDLVGRGEELCFDWPASRKPVASATTADEPGWRAASGLRGISIVPLNQATAGVVSGLRYGGQKLASQPPDRPDALRRSGRRDRPFRRRAARTAGSQARAHRSLPGAHGRRVGAGVHRVAGSAQHQSWSREGRHSLSPRRRRSTSSRRSPCS